MVDERLLDANTNRDPNDAEGPGSYVPRGRLEDLKSRKNILL